MATLAKMVTKTLDVGVKDTKIDLSATIKSYDLTDTKFIFNIISNQGLNIDLMGSTATYVVEYVHNSQNYALQGNVDIIDSTTIAFSLPEDLKGYNGNALIGLYVQMADGTKIDLKDIVVKIEPSIMDKGIDFTAKTYFEDFETVKAEVILAGENAKNQINAVLPTIQSQVSELDRQIKALPQIPDLFVAYANSADGSVDFSRAKPKENLWEQSKTVDGWFENDGTLTNAYSATQHKIYPEYISVNPNDIYYLTIINPKLLVNTINSNKYAFYDTNKALISWNWVNLNASEVEQIKITIPDNARYMRVGVIQGVESYDSSIKIKLEKSDTPTTYLPSKYDNYLDNYMKYIGYSVKNSTNPSDYRWQVNPEWQKAQLDYEKVSAIKNNLINLCVNGDFSQNKNGWNIADGIEYTNDRYVKKNPYHYFYQDIPLTNKHIVYVKGTTGVEANNLGIVSRINLFIIGTYTYLKSVTNTSTVSTSSTLLEINNGGIRIDLSKEGIDENNTVGVWLDDILVYDLTSIFGTGNEPSLEEFERLLAINVNSTTVYSQSITRAKMNAHPINSLYYTESVESPETTFGGKWTKLGTEAKFSKTFNVWQRTQ